MLNDTSAILPLLTPTLNQASSLPAMPEVAARLLATLQQENTSMDAVTRLIERDQVLTAKVLRLANSARYSRGHGVRTLHDAAATLGLRALRDLTLSACLVGVFPEQPGLDRLTFWQGSVATAACARHLAGALGQDTDVAWLCGLMLRTGQLLMLQFDAPRTLLVQRMTANGVDAVIGYERSLIGCSHPEITAELARHWRFPAQLVDGLAAAAAPLERRPFSRLGALLRLASVAADARRLDSPLPEVLPQVQGDLLAHLQLDVDALDARLPPWAQIIDGVEELLH